jgi:uncharacterized delta-60 repeat protein
MDGGGVVETNITNLMEYGRAIEMQADGTLVAAGFAQMTSTKIKGKTVIDHDAVLVRYNADGSLDSSFSGDGIQTTQIAGNSDVYWDVAIQQDQKVVGVGYATGSGQNAYSNAAVVRHLPDGSLDTSFSGDGKAFADFGATAQVFAGTIQPDGKIVVAGRAYLSPTRFAVARFNADGSLDTSFGSGGKVTTNFGVGGYQNHHEANGLVIQPDGKILVSGSGGAYQLLARYNANGTLDTSFDGDGKVIRNSGLSQAGLGGLALQPDGKILAVGGTPFQGVGLILRYNPDGSLDTSFGASGVVQHPHITTFVRGVALQSDGRIIVSGGRDWKASRLNSDGSLDTSFAGTGSVQVVPSGAALSTDLLLQPDGKIVMSGYNESTGNFITARVNSDGTMDTTWGGGAAAASNVTVAPPPPGASTSVSALDVASVQQLLSEPEAKNTWTRKARFKLFAL